MGKTRLTKKRNCATALLLFLNISIEIGQLNLEEKSERKYQGRVRVSGESDNDVCR